jgi:phospholipid/cholesterol/gamma-HCH transport system substrate-binding protein
MGEKTVAIIPKAPHKGKIPKPVTEDQVVYADSIDPLENALTHFSDMSEKIEHLVSDIDEWFIENSDDLSQAITSFSGSMNQLDTALNSVNEEELVKKISEAVAIAKNDLELIQSTLLEIQQSDTVGKFNNLVDGFSEVADSFNTQGKQIMQNMTVITNDIADGTGSLGKFIKSDDFYLRVSAIMSKVNTLMNDLNHYGLLFQYDKHWQRSRTKKANLLEALDSPRDFRNYFDNEMDSITTALARLTVLMEKAQQPGERDKVLGSEAFKSDFNLLMNEVQDLYDTIKLYNEELIDNQQKACN